MCLSAPQELHVDCWRAVRSGELGFRYSCSLLAPLLWEFCCYPALTQVDLHSPGCLAEPSAPAPPLPDGGGATPGGILWDPPNSSSGSADWTPRMVRAISLCVLGFLSFSFWGFFPSSSFLNPFCVLTYMFFFPPPLAFLFFGYTLIGKGKSSRNVDVTWRKTLPWRGNSTYLRPHSKVPGGGWSERGSVYQVGPHTGWLAAHLLCARWDTKCVNSLRAQDPEWAHH